MTDHGNESGRVEFLDETYLYSGPVDPAPIAPMASDERSEW